MPVRREQRNGQPYLGPERPALRLALAFAAAEQRPPTDADRPPLTTFPMTPGAREALRLVKESPGYKERLRGTGRPAAA